MLNRISPSCYWSTCKVTASDNFPPGSFDFSRLLSWTVSAGPPRARILNWYGHLTHTPLKYTLLTHNFARLLKLKQVSLTLIYPLWILEKVLLERKQCKLVSAYYSTFLEINVARYQKAKVTWITLVPQMQSEDWEKFEDTYVTSVFSEYHVHFQYYDHVIQIKLFIIIYMFKRM